MPTRSVLAMLCTSAIVVAGCGASEEPATGGGTSVSESAQEQSLLAAHDLDGLDARQVVDRLDRMAVADRPDDLLASIRPDELLLSDPQGGGEESLPMPEDEFYLSFAPYEEQTHDCFFHSLTTCLGEMTGEEVDVHLETSDGEVLVDETMTTFDNGFVGLWLPRGIDATLTVTRDGATGSAEVSTGEDDLTCLTTLQLV